MKTVKHELEARKYTIPDEEPMEEDVHLILIDQETDLSQLQLQLDPTDPTSSEINVRPQTCTNEEIPGDSLTMLYVLTDEGQITLKRV